MILPRAMLRACRKSLRRSKLADTTGAELSGGAVLMRTLILRRLLRRHVLEADEKNVGLLLPPSAGAVLANAALSLDRRVAVNLNYTVSSELMNVCIRKAGLRHVLTSRKVLERFPLEIEAELVYLEDFKDKVTLLDKLVGAVGAYVEPLALLERRLRLRSIGPDDLLTIIFTSGSTGEPKGVMLSHNNVGSNVEAIDQIVRLSRDDVLAGILPLFHSLGYTTTMWTVLTLEPKGVYHVSPLDTRLVGRMCHEHRATILIATPTFLRSYLRRCPPEDFASLDVVVAGAEKLPVELCEAFEQRFGVRPVEGYGTTELSPLVSVNIPPSRASSEQQVMLKEGTVGRPIPGVAVKIVHTESGEELGPNEAGMLLAKGPNVMLGYYGEPEKTAKVMRGEWYVTGDIALVDEDGFIKITGRESRFSKIAGEMVPHIKIEETLQQIVGAGEDELKIVVTAVPDERRGERIVVMHTALDKPAEQICKELSAAGLPNLWIPSADSFCEVAEIPVLGTGKLDLKGLKDLALEKFGARVE